MRLFISLMICFVCVLSAAAFAAATPAEKLLEQPDDWYLHSDGQATLQNLLAWQTKYGDWPKNTDTTKQTSDDEKAWTGTFDNGATIGELRVLARAYRITHNEAYKVAFLRGFDHVMTAQYAHGGWPQYFPLSKKYHRHVTFNDGTMIRIMRFLQDALSGTDFNWLDSERREQALHAVSQGIQCILKCQILVDGKLTVWCAQHDAQTLQATGARDYEHPSLSGAESAGILNFLMDIEEPTPEITAAIEAGVQWFKKSRIEGFRFEKSAQRLLIEDTSAEPLWARFYEIGTNRPIFSGRDGIIKYDLQDIDEERRNGYAWYGNWGKSVIDRHSSWVMR